MANGCQPREIQISDAANAKLTRVCHDLRQPMQTLVLLQALLAKSVDDERSRTLVARVGAALDAMVAILDDPSNPLPQEFRTSEPTEIQHIMPTVAKPAAVGTAFAPVVFVVDDDCDVRAAIRCVLEDDGQIVEEFASCEAFLEHDRSDRDGCLLVDAYLPAMSGLELLQKLQASGHTLPAIMITGNSDVAMAVNAMKAGAVDFIEKPIGHSQLLASIQHANHQSKDLNSQLASRQDAARHVAVLTARQRQIMDRVLAGQPNKNIAADLGISQRTVENHRAAIMKRTGAASLPALARLVVTASIDRPPA